MDVIVNAMELAVEVKATGRVTSDHVKGLRNLREDHPEAKRRIVVCLEPKRRRTEDGIDILPAPLFARMLWEGELF